ncbi:adenine nucleotide alpha hydrolases-like protein [Rhizopus microsporus ATCC 52813]|uniref:Adenine nucleotide alpha hydrolases-like protein n=1 Tax=Rhizopus microsporus ATCC 52813 TaxID=1340429 RepID=A0A2G4T4S8_RHIZD|nr:adenine nucleotide alpha hydrolases-like protein [Rhizopus microsporus ATCC 52813]PHZ16010.1 adenine nucleotide alpha hydrolases-like protein [Rhizopus microsporus ATCC 52813]
MARQIAFAIDPLSEESKKTIQWSKDNFLRPDDEIHAIMVLVMDAEFIDQEDPIELPSSDTFKEIEQEVTAEKVNAMNKIVQDLQASGYRVITHIFKTDSTRARTVLTDYLNTIKVDCLILGSRNLSGWTRFFSGSFSNYVQTHVNCPVLIVR